MHWDKRAGCNGEGSKLRIFPWGFGSLGPRVFVRKALLHVQALHFRYGSI